MTWDVLIVDDSATMRHFLQRALKLAGVEVGHCYQASNGDAALEVLAREKVDLLITDLNMPVLDGAGLIKRLRERGLLDRLKCMIVTAESSPSRLGNMNDLGSVGYLRKPFTPEQLAATLQRVVETKP